MGQNKEKIPIIVSLIVLLAAIVFNQTKHQSPFLRHYYFLSLALLQKKLHVTDQIMAYVKAGAPLEAFFDYAIVNQTYFVYLGLFPAIVGVPFLIFGGPNHLTTLIIFFLILSLLTLKKFIKHYLPQESALLIALLLVISSPLLTAIAFRGPWYLAALITSCFGLLFLWHYVVQKKNWGILFIIPAFLTRPTTVFYFLIPFLESFTPNKKRKEKIIHLSLALVLTLSIWGSYNYFRFGNPLEAGYRYAVVPEEEYGIIRSKEPFSQNNIFSNFLYLFFNPPRTYINKALRFTFPYFELSRFGVGLLFIIPWFLPYLFAKNKWRQDWPYLLTTLSILTPILLFSGEGSFQIGSRYSCDFLPLLFFLNLKWLGQNKSKIPLFKKLLNLSFFLNFYFYFLLVLGHIRRV